MKARFLAVCLLVVSGCGTGVCLGTDGIYGHTYCYDDFTSAECEDYASEGVNGATWEFYPGDTCWDLGYNEGSN